VDIFVVGPESTIYRKIKQTASTTTPTGTVTSSTDNGGITNFTAILESTLPTTGKPTGNYFPHGLFSFNIISIVQGSTVTVTLTLPTTMPLEPNIEMPKWYMG